MKYCTRNKHTDFTRNKKSHANGWLKLDFTCDENCVAYLPFIVYKTTINSFKTQILSNICVDQNTNKSTISHHELQMSY